MALVKQSLESQILNLINDLSARTENQPQSNQDFAKQLATIIDAYIRTATVTVVTTGSATTQTGTGTLS